MVSPTKFGIVHLKGLPAKISIKLCILSLKIVLVLANSKDPDERLS